jgi:hypothetical protein
LTTHHNAIPPDNGCKAATTFLGCQSHCLDCPFPECLEMDKNRNAWAENKRQSDVGDDIILRGRPKIIADKERCQRIIRLHKEGKTQGEIQAQTSSCPTTIRKVIKAAGLTPLKRGRRPNTVTEHRKHAIKCLQKEGKTIAVIAQTVGVDQSYVRQVLRGVA